MDTKKLDGTHENWITSCYNDISNYSVEAKMRNKTAIKEFVCSNCKKVLQIRADQLAKRKTTLCKTCMLKQWNRTEKMREVSRRTGKFSPSDSAKEKLRQFQNAYWTKEKRATRKGKGNPAWIGGKVTMNGYVYIHCPEHSRATKRGKYVKEHVLIMEKYLGRYLTKKEVVHHINGNRSDNRIENLLLTNQSDHMKIHMLERKNNANRDVMG